MDEESDLVDSCEEELGFVGDLRPYPSAAEERDLWRRYFKLRRINEILGPKAGNDILQMRSLILKIVEDIATSFDLIGRLKELSGLDKIGDKIIEGPYSDTNTIIELYRLIQVSEKGVNRAETTYNRYDQLQDLFGFVFVEMLNNIAFGKGSPDLVDKAAMATNSDTFDIRVRIYRFAIDRELLPKSLMQVVEPTSPVIKLPQLVRRIRIEQLTKNVLNDYWWSIKNIRTDGKTAFDQIVETHLKLVVKCARVFAAREGSLPIEDLYQEGSLGLMKAVEHFSPAYGHRFMSYAPDWIRQSVTRAIADSGRVVRIPVHMNETINKLLHLSRILAQEYGREPTSKELGQRMGLSSKQVREIVKVAQLPIYLDRDDLIEDRDTLPLAETASKQLLKEQIDEVLSSLTHREQRVLVLRFGLEDGRSRTLEEVGQEFNVTRERIRQIEAKALRRLRHPSRSRKLKDFL